MCMYVDETVRLTLYPPWSPYGDQGLPPTVGRTARTVSQYFTTITPFFLPIHSGGELARTSDLGLMFSDLTIGRRGSPPQATPLPGWHDTGRTSPRCQPEPVGPSESVARAREPWADTFGTIPLPADVIRASRPQPAGCSADLDDVSIRGE